MPELLESGDIVIYIGKHPVYHNPHYEGAVGQLGNQERTEAGEVQWWVTWWPFFCTSASNGNKLHYAENLVKL